MKKRFPVCLLFLGTLIFGQTSAFADSDPAVHSMKHNYHLEFPTLKQILERYVDDRPYAGPKKVIPFEAFSKIPDKSLFILKDPENIEREGFDGNTRWRQDKNGLVQRENQERSQMDYFLDPQNALRIQEYFPRMELMGEAKLRGFSVYVLENSRKSPHYTLYFDVDTGLLIQIGYYELHEYQAVDGVRFPFRLEYSRKGGSNTYIFDDVRHNIPVDDERFSMPGKGTMDLWAGMR